MKMSVSIKANFNPKNYCKYLISYLNPVNSIITDNWEDVYKVAQHGHEGTALNEFNIFAIPKRRDAKGYKPIIEGRFLTQSKGQ